MLRSVRSASGYAGTRTVARLPACPPARLPACPPARLPARPRSGRRRCEPPGSGGAAEPTRQTRAAGHVPNKRIDATGRLMTGWDARDADQSAAGRDGGGGRQALAVLPTGGPLLEHPAAIGSHGPGLLRRRLCRSRRCRRTSSERPVRRLVPSASGAESAIRPGACRSTRHLLGEHWYTERSPGLGVESPGLRVGTLARQRLDHAVRAGVPPAGFEPAHTAPEAVALSPELRGRAPRCCAATGRTLPAPGGCP